MKYLVAIILLFIFQNLRCQDNTDEQLVKSFFEFREYEKAEIYLKKLFEVNPVKFYAMTMKTQMELKKYDDAIHTIKTVLKKDKANVNYQYALGTIYFKKNDTAQGKKEWNLAMNIAQQNLDKAPILIELFRTNKNWTYLEATILKTRDKLNNPSYLQDVLIDVYLAQKKYSEAIELIIHIAESDDVNYMVSFQRIQNYIEDNEMMRIVQKKVYAKYSQNQNIEKWNQMAIWLSLMTKDYEESMTIAKAYDRRIRGNGTYILSVADVAYNEEAYEVAIDGYRYLTKIQTNNEMVKLGFEKEIQTYYTLLHNSTKLDTVFMDSIYVRFSQYFQKYGKSYSTADIQILQAELLVYYFGNLEAAIEILQNLSDQQNLPKSQRSRAMLNLADYRLMNGDIWEASLIYGKVDKDEKDSPLGEEARYKNSKVFYYNGDFELAAELLSILKYSTTELLANDALYLSVFIQDNLDNDSFQNAMKEIASAELLFYQNKSKEALAILTEIKTGFPNSKLIDDILMIEAAEALKSKNYPHAIDLFQQVMEKFASSILADKAVYEWSKIQEMIYKDAAKATEGYLKILTAYKDSVYTSDARKRLRKLRGEKEPEL